MTTTIDARGLSCPQPVLLTLEAIEKINHGQLTILVDSDTSKENVLRAAASQGWQEAGVQEQAGEHRITLNKGLAVGFFNLFKREPWLLPRRNLAVWVPAS